MALEETLNLKQSYFIYVMTGDYILRICSYGHMSTDVCFS